MQYIRIIVPSLKKNKYCADSLKELMPKNIRANIVSLAEYQKMKDGGNTNDDLKIFLGDDNGSLKHGKVLYPSDDETWGTLADGDRRSFESNMKIKNAIRITAMGRSALIQCNAIDYLNLNERKVIFEKMDALFKEFELTVESDISEIMGLGDLIDTATNIFRYAFDSSKELVNKKIRKKGNQKYEALQVLKNNVTAHIPVEFVYQYAICVFIKNYLSYLVNDNRKEYEDSTNRNFEEPKLSEDVKKN